MAQSQPASGLHKPSVALWYSDECAGGYQASTAAGSQLNFFAGYEIGAGIAISGIAGKRQVRTAANNGDLQHGGDNTWPEQTLLPI